MKVYGIDSDNGIELFASIEEAKDAGFTETFSDAEGFAALAAEWTAERLLDTFNSIPGFTPVKRFENRAVAIRRIWTAVQSLKLPDDGQAGEPVASAPTYPKFPKPSQMPSRKKAATAKPKKAKATPSTKKAPKSQREPSVGPREGSKTEAAIALMRRKDGATIDELVEVTGWNKNSVFGFVSGTVGKKLGHKVESFKDEKTKARTYRIAA